MEKFTHFIPTELHFGAGALSQLGKIRLPGKKALIVMSAGKSLKAAGVPERVAKLLKEGGADSLVYDKIQPNPTLDSIREGARIAKEKGCDFVVGLGGGSPVDSSKSIAVVAAMGGDYWDYINGGSGKGKPVTAALPIVAIPTTAGTGTEIDPWTVVTKEETNEKIGAGWRTTFPKIAIVDPELMLSIPPELTAYQGFDAFFHSAEGFIASIANSISDAYAEKSLQLLYKNLPLAVKDGKNLAARSAVALASTIAGMVESTSSCTSEHSLEHALSAYYPALPHGAGLIMLSKAYFEFFAEKIPDRVAMMAKGMLQREKATAGDFLKALADMQKECGVGALKMSAYGIKEADLPKFVKNARENMGGLFNLDRHSLSDAETLEILRKSFA